MDIKRNPSAVRPGTQTCTVAFHTRIPFDSIAKWYHEIFRAYGMILVAESQGIASIANMPRIESLKRKVKDLYGSRNPNREDWADWLCKNHIFIVADYACELAKRYGADKELASAAGMLHDIGDAEMSRFNPEHEKRSSEIARKLLTECEFSEAEIAIVVDDAMRFHGCHGDERPASLEGKIMAAADALAHLKTDFYKHALKDKSKKESLNDIQKWALPKLERDFTNKIAFDGVREEARTSYEELRTFFSNLN